MHEVFGVVARLARRVGVSPRSETPIGYPNLSCLVVCCFRAITFAAQGRRWRLAIYSERLFLVGGGPHSRPTVARRPLTVGSPWPARDGGGARCSPMRPSCNPPSTSGR